MTSATVGPLPATVAQRYPHGYAVVDVETSGLNASTHRVLQIAVSQMRPDGALEGTWSTLLDPGCDPGPVEVHGLTRAKLAGSPQFDQVCAQLTAMLAGRVFVAHNAAFDWRFLTAETRRAGTIIDATGRLCTIAMTRRLDVPSESLKLSAVAQYWGVRQYAAHDAADDTRVTLEILRHSLVVADRLNLRLPLITPEVDDRRPGYPIRAPRVACSWRYPGRLGPDRRLRQGMTVAFTGASRQPREALIRLATRAGLDVMNSVSSRTSLVVQNRGTHFGDKSAAAATHGTTVIDETEFVRMLDDVRPGTPKAAAPATDRAVRQETAEPAPRRRPTPTGPLAAQRILVLGGPHDHAAAVRARISELGGQAAANLTASVGSVVLLDGHVLDPRWGRVTMLALPTLDPDTLTPAPHTASAPPVPAPSPSASPAGQLGTPAASAATVDTTTVLSRGAVIDLPAGRRWTIDVSWSSAGNAAQDIAVDVVAFVVDADEQVAVDEDFCFYNQPRHPSGGVTLDLQVPTEAVVAVDLDRLPDHASRVIIAAAIDGTQTFGDLGPIELTVRDDDGRRIARSTLDAARRERTLLLCDLYDRAGQWRVRSVGQGYLDGLAHLAVLHGVDVED